MALKRKGMTKVALNATTLTLSMLANESCLVTEVRIHTLALAAETIKFSIDQRRVGNFYAASGINLLIEQKQDNITSIMHEVRKAGLFPTYPVASGQSFIITDAPAGSYIEVIYDLYDAQDIKDTLPNGFRGADFRIFNTISNGTVLATAGDLPLNVSDIESIFPAFPAGESVPAGYECTLRAILGTTTGKGTGAANGEFTTRLKFVRDREELFDKDLLGILHHGDNVGVTAALLYDTLYGRLVRPAAGKLAEIIVIPDPPKFYGGNELNVIATIGRTGAGADFVAGDVKITLVLDYRRTGS